MPDSMPQGRERPAMIDLHCHLLPGLDDGARTHRVARAMAQAAVAAGVGQIVCTPHCTADDRGLAGRIARIRRSVEALNRELVQMGLPLRLHTGMELMCGEKLPQMVERGEVLTLAESRYLLIEFLFDASRPRIERAADQVRGGDISRSWPIRSAMPPFSETHRAWWTGSMQTVCFSWIRTVCWGGLATAAPALRIGPWSAVWPTWWPAMPTIHSAAQFPWTRYGTTFGGATPPAMRTCCFGGTPAASWRTRLWSLRMSFDRCRPQNGVCCLDRGSLFLLAVPVTYVAEKVRRPC